MRSWPPSAEVIVDVAPRALSDADLESLVTRANGNPRFAVRLAQLASIDDDLPPSIEALVATEIDRIPPGPRTILREAATAGVESTISDLVEQCERAEHEVRSAVAAGRGLVTIVAFDVVRFVDDTVREVLAGGLPVRRRRHLHRRRLIMLERRDDIALARLAYHAIESGDHEAIARWCEEAAAAAMRAGESAAAARVARHGLAAAQRSIGESNPQDRARIVRIAVLLADACHAAGLPDGERDALVTAGRFETDRRRSIDIAIRRAAIARQQFRLSSARSLLARCARTPEIDAGAMRSLDLERARLAWYEGRSADAMRRLGDLAQQSLDAGDHRVRAYALALLEQLLASSGSERARPVGLEAAEAAEASGDETMIGMVYGNLAISADNRGEWGTALEWYERGADVARRAGDVATMARLTDNRASIQVELGDVDPLVGSLSRTGRVEAAAGLDDAAAINRCLAARVDLRRGGLTAEAAASLVGAARAAVDVLGGLPDEEVAETTIPENEAGAAEAPAGGQPTSESVVEPGDLVVINRVPGDSYGRVVVIESDGTRRELSPTCERMHASGGVLLCMRTSGDLGQTGTADVLSLDDPNLPLLSFLGVGLPSRARVARDGSFAALTSFVTGHSYLQAGEFSTQTVVFTPDFSRQPLHLEDLAIADPAERYRAVDGNWWGVTFAPAEPGMAFATYGSGGNAEILRVDAESGTAELFLPDGSCPSVSPDGRWLVYKRPVPGATAPRSLVLHDLLTGAERALAEDRFVDDQVEWLDNDTVLYAVARENTSAP